MLEIVQQLNFLLATGALLLLTFSAFMLVDILVYRRGYLQSFIESWGLAILALLFIGSMGTALLYSEVFGFVPCGLCWTIRIFSFSQAVILPFAFVRQDTAFALYGIILSSLGLITALYQHFLQTNGASWLPCPASGGDCAKRILFEYGFMTFPLLAATLFLTSILVYWYLHNAR